MYKLLIVDDERIIREGMKKLIPWENIGIALVLTAASAQEALKIIQEEKPQLLITDINMPEMSGIQMLEEAYRIVPEIRAVILTGYDYFEYARDALRLHVQDFLLKPVHEAVLYECIKKQIEFLDERRAITHGPLRASSIQKQFELERITRLLIKDEDTERAARQLEEMGHLRSDAQFMVAVLLPDFPPEERALRLQELCVFCMNEVDVKGYGFTVIDKQDDEIWIFYMTEACPLDGERMFGDLLGLIRSEFSEMPRAAIGTQVTGAADIVFSYQEARQLLSVDHPQGGLCLPRDLTNRNRRFCERFEELKDAMCVGISNPEKVAKQYEAFFALADEYHKTEQDVGRYAFRLISELYYTCLTAGIPVSEGFLGQAAVAFASANRNECRELGMQYIRFMLASRETENNKMVMQAREYIDQHLADSISVSDIASRFFVSPNYFSRLFKKTMGEGCNDYIVRKRMEKAKSLLTSTDFSAGRIANMVGYSDTNYFSMAFKKHCGISPTSYRAGKGKG